MAYRLAAERVPRYSLPQFREHGSNPTTDLFRSSRPGEKGRSVIRSRVPEIMDDPGLDAEDHVRALRALQRMHALLRSDRRLARHIATLAGTPAPAVLDVGCGGGSLLRTLAGGTRAIGLDRSATALRTARGWDPVGISWLRGDARHLPLEARSVDVVTCALFLHHFDAPDVVRILREAARVARIGVVLTDLARSRLAWGLTWVFTRMVTRSAVVHVDGPRSVRAAYRLEELAALAREAGMVGADVRGCIPFRLRLTWIRTEGNRACRP